MGYAAGAEQAGITAQRSFQVAASSNFQMHGAECQRRGYDRNEPL